MTNERHAGGLWCRDVLARLADYLDGSLDEPSRQSVDAHLRECQACASFGGDYSDIVGALHRKLADDLRPVDDELAERISRATASGARTGSGGETP